MAPEYNTFSSNAKAVALTLLTIVSSTSAMDLSLIHILFALSFAAGYMTMEVLGAGTKCY